MGQPSTRCWATLIGPLDKKIKNKNKQKKEKEKENKIEENECTRIGLYKPPFNIEAG